MEGKHLARSGVRERGGDIVEVPGAVYRPDVLAHRVRGVGFALFTGEPAHDGLGIDPAVAGHDDAVYDALLLGRLRLERGGHHAPEKRRFIPYGLKDLSFGYGGRVIKGHRLFTRHAYGPPVHDGSGTKARYRAEHREVRARPGRYLEGVLLCKRGRALLKHQDLYEVEPDYLGAIGPEGSGQRVHHHPAHLRDVGACVHVEREYEHPWALRHGGQLKHQQYQYGQQAGANEPQI